MLVRGKGGLGSEHFASIAERRRDRAVPARARNRDRARLQAECVESKRVESEEESSQDANSSKAAYGEEEALGLRGRRQASDRMASTVMALGVIAMGHLALDHDHRGIVLQAIPI